MEERITIISDSFLGFVGYFVCWCVVYHSSYPSLPMAKSLNASTLKICACKEFYYLHVKIESSL